MNAREALRRAAYQFLLFLLFAQSLFFIAVRYVPHVRVRIADFFLLYPSICAKVGGMGLGLTFLLSLVLMRPKTLRVAVNTSVDLILIAKALEERLSIAPIAVERVRRGRLEISVPVGIHSLRELEATLAPFLRTQFGYEKPFYLRLRESS